MNCNLSLVALVFDFVLISYDVFCTTYLTLISSNKKQYKENQLWQKLKKKATQIIAILVQRINVDCRYTNCNNDINNLIITISTENRNNDKDNENDASVTILRFFLPSFIFFIFFIFFRPICRILIINSQQNSF